MIFSSVYRFEIIIGACNILIYISQNAIFNVYVKASLVLFVFLFQLTRLYYGVLVIFFDDLNLVK